MFKPPTKLQWAKCSQTSTKNFNRLCKWAISAPCWIKEGDRAGTLKRNLKCWLLRSWLEVSLATFWGSSALMAKELSLSPRSISGSRYRGQIRVRRRIKLISRTRKYRDWSSPRILLQPILEICRPPLPPISSRISDNSKRSLNNSRLLLNLNLVNKNLQWQLLANKKISLLNKFKKIRIGTLVLKPLSRRTLWWVIINMRQKLQWSADVKPRHYWLRKLEAMNAIKMSSKDSLDKLKSHLFNRSCSRLLTKIL